MTDDHQDKLLEHEYDGIRELDNNLPRWWLYLFYISIVFSLLYMLYYHVFRFGYLQEEEYRAATDTHYVRDVSHNPLTLLAPEYRAPWHSPARDQRNALLRSGQEMQVMAGSPQLDITFTEPLSSQDDLTIGKKLFDANCVVCHAADGGGGTGPNLTDKVSIHGNSFADKVKVIVHGVPAKGMLAWGEKLGPEKIHQVASYVHTLQGTTPANPLPPQGEMTE